MKQYIVDAFVEQTFEANPAASVSELNITA